MVICPVCKKPLPTSRFPTNLKQALWGGWTCKNCGCEVDSKGNNLTKKREKELYEEELIKERARLQAQKEFKQKKK